jgi:hypothetical protein
MVTPSPQSIDKDFFPNGVLRFSATVPNGSPSEEDEPFRGITSTPH